MISPVCPMASRRFRIWEPIPDGVSSRSFQEAAGILKKAHQPLIVLTGHGEQELVVAAVNLASAISASLVRDNNTCENFTSAMQKAGLLSATLADLRKRSDRVVILGDDPEISLPRFWEFMGRGKKEKAVWISARQIVESIQQLRLHDRGLKTSFDEDLKTAASRIGQASSGVVMINGGSTLADVNALTEVLLWVKELGGAKKWYGQVLFPAANEIGISQALRSTTGYSGGLSFRKGKISHDPRLFQLEKRIEYGETDAILIIGDMNLVTKRILRKIVGIKSIVLSPEKPQFHADAWLPCARAGIDALGTMLRLDDIPVKLDPLVPSVQATARDFLVKLAHEVKA